MSQVAGGLSQSVCCIHEIAVRFSKRAAAIQLYGRETDEKQVVFPDHHLTVKGRNSFLLANITRMFLSIDVFQMTPHSETWARK